MQSPQLRPVAALAAFLLLALSLATTTSAWAEAAPGLASLPACDDDPSPDAGPCDLNPAWRLSDRTRISILPLGTTVRPGRVVVRVHELTLWNVVDIGITDHIELTMGAPIIPVVAMGGLRVRLTPRSSPWRVLLDAAVTQLVLVEPDSPVVGTGAITTAYQGENVNLHATVGGITHEQSYSNGEARVWNLTALASVGAVYHPPGSRWAFFGELGRLRSPSGDRYPGALGGVKLMGRSVDFDLGVLVPLGQSDRVAVPILSFSYRP
ncbi:hypothetical protein [Haliangium sp.]|uniref:hypothetical protein n=1 Tax=Haliangium sp. TaxID=2663208 RepID=UPI003D0987EF